MSTEVYPIIVNHIGIPFHLMNAIVLVEAHCRAIVELRHNGDAWISSVDGPFCEGNSDGNVGMALYYFKDFIDRVVLDIISDHGSNLEKFSEIESQFYKVAYQTNDGVLELWRKAVAEKKPFPEEIVEEIPAITEALSEPKFKLTLIRSEPTCMYFGE